MDGELAFGPYLKQLIRQKGFTQAEFRRSLNISKTYLVDIENGDAYPPLKLQIRMSTLLLLGNAEKAVFFDKAALGRGELPTDVFLYLMSHQNKIRELRQEIYGNTAHRNV